MHLTMENLMHIIRTDSPILMDLRSSSDPGHSPAPFDLYLSFKPSACYPVAQLSLGIFILSIFISISIDFPLTAFSLLSH